MLVHETSKLRNVPDRLSRKQILIFDGIRYAAEMAEIAYARLLSHLRQISEAKDQKPTTRDIAVAMLDAWSIVDSVNRFCDLVAHAPGLPNDPWKRLLSDRTKDVEELRHCVQHQPEKLNPLVKDGGQVWGYLSWAVVRNGKHRGEWMMMSPGAVYVGDKWLFMGPANPGYPLPLRRIRLNAFGKELYLGAALATVWQAVRNLEGALADGLVAVSAIQPPLSAGEATEFTADLSTSR